MFIAAVMELDHQLTSRSFAARVHFKLHYNHHHLHPPPPRQVPLVVIVSQIQAQSAAEFAFNLEEP